MEDPRFVQSKKINKPFRKTCRRKVAAAVLAFACLALCMLLLGCAAKPSYGQYDGTSANRTAPAEQSAPVTSSTDPQGSGETVLIGGETVAAETIARTAEACGISEAELTETLERYASARSAVKEILSSGNAVKETERATLEDALERMKQDGTIGSWAFDEESGYYVYQIVGGGIAAVPLEDHEIAGRVGKAAPYALQSLCGEQRETFVRDNTPTSGTRPRIHVLWSFNSDHSLYRFYGRTFWNELGAEVVFDDEVTLDDLRNLDQGEFDLTVFMCHGGAKAGGVIPPSLMIETPPTMEELAMFFEQCRTHALSLLSAGNQGLVPLPNGWMVTPKFFTHTYGAERRLHGAFLFYSCYFFGSSRNPYDTWPQTILDLGAETVLGFRNSTWAYYAWHFVRTVVSQMLCGASIQDGYEIAIDLWGDSDGGYLCGRDHEGQPKLAGDRSYRLPRTVDADPADELNAELRRQKEVYREFLENTTTVTTKLCPDGIFRIDGYALEDISGDGIPELLLSTTQDNGDGITGILVCDVAMKEKVWPVYYQKADPVISSVWLVNERWLRTDYHGTSGSGGSWYSSMYDLEDILFAHTEPDENGEGFGVRCFVDPGIETEFDKWHEIGSLLQKGKEPQSVAVTRAALEEYLMILPNTRAGEREIVFRPRNEPFEINDEPPVSDGGVTEIYLRFVEEHRFFQTDYYPYGVSFDISAYAMEDLSGDGIPELILATSQDSYFSAEITGILVCTVDDDREVIPVFFMDTDTVFPIPSIVDERWIVFCYHGTGGYTETYYRTITPDGVEEAKEVHSEGSTAYYTPMSRSTKEQFENYLLTVSGKEVSSERDIAFTFLN